MVINNTKRLLGILGVLLLLYFFSIPLLGVTVSFGQTVSGTITAGKEETYTFSATAGNKVLIRMSRTSGDFWPYIRLLNPTGTMIGNSYGSSSAELISISLPSTGTYTIIADDEIGTYSGGYNLTLERQGHAVYTLYVNSNPITGMNVSITPNDNNGSGNGSTNFTRLYNQGTQVTLTAPSIFNGKNFIKWKVDNVDKTGRTISVTMNSDHTALAVYQAYVYILTVQSSPDPGVTISITPNDNNNQGNGETEFLRTYNYGTIVTLTAPGTHNGRNFSKWIIDGKNYTGITQQITMDRSHIAQAIYQSSTYKLSV